MARPNRNVASLLRVFVLFNVFLHCTAQAFAQTASSEVTVTGAINAGANVSGGTQAKKDISGSFDLAVSGGTAGADIGRQVRFRAEGTYGESQSPGKAKTVGAEMYYVEARGAADLGEMLGVEHEADSNSGIWVIGIASVLHNIAFDLDTERAIGVGVAYDNAALRGLSLSVDLRHIQERFATQPEFSSWAIGLRQSYSHSWTVTDVPACAPCAQPVTRIFVLSESLEVVPAFESRDALQLRGVVSLAIPIVRSWNMLIAYGSDYMRNVPASTHKQHFWKTTFSLNYTFSN